jgi:hypothetical protein
MNQRLEYLLGFLAPVPKEIGGSHSCTATILLSASPTANSGMDKIICGSVAKK